MQTQIFASPYALQTQPGTNVTSGNTGTISNPSPGTITVTTDKPSYNDGDTLTISGSTQDYISGTPVTIKIISPTGLIVKVDQVDVESDRTYSESILPSNMRWMGAGTYQVIVQYGSPDRLAQTTFQFIGTSSTTQTGNTVPTNPLITVSIDKPSYMYGNTILVSGTVQQVVPGVPVTIQIFDPSNSLAYTSSVDISQDGKYANSITITGPYWKLGGTYVILVQNGPPNIRAEVTFTYVTKNPYLECPDCNQTTTSHANNPYLGCPDCKSTTNASTSATTPSSSPPTIPSTPVTPAKIPHWVKTLFNLYGQGQVSDDDLISALKFLIQSGVIKVS